MPGQTYTASSRLLGGQGREADATPLPGSPRTALAVAALCALVLAAVWALAAFVPLVHVKDAVGLYEFTRLDQPRVDTIAEFLLRLLEPTVFVLWGIALVALALAAGRPRVALAVVAVLVVAPFSADVLKPLLAHSHARVHGVAIGPASWPSGHSTAAMALALCAVLVSPARLRRAVALLGAVFVAAISVSLLILAWHMPSDVIGGIFIASLWMALAIAALRASERGGRAGRHGA